MMCCNKTNIILYTNKIFFMYLNKKRIILKSMENILSGSTMIDM